MIPDEWDEDTEVHCQQAELLRRKLMEEIDLVAESAKRKDPRRE